MFPAKVPTRRGTDDCHAGLGGAVRVAASSPPALIPATAGPGGRCRRSWSRTNDGSFCHTPCSVVLQAQDTAFILLHLLAGLGLTSTRRAR